MATIAAKDYRRSDTRKQTLENPVFIASDVFGPEVDDKATVLFSFPKVPIPDNLAPYGTYQKASDLGILGKHFMIEDAAVEIIEPFVGGTVSLSIGMGTIPTDAIVDGTTLVTYTATDGVVTSAAVTESTAGMYPSAAALRIHVTNADASTPCVFAALTSDGVIKAGKARLHLKLSRIGSVK